jgi:putative tryptophan/tyrosine transport system substrate-binding protein
MSARTKRRDFIALLGGAAAWPLAARAQQANRMRRIGVVMYAAQQDQDGQARLAAFVEVLRRLGWTEGVNVRFDVRWGASNNDLYRRYATELVSAAPDIVLGTDTPSVVALQDASRDIPIVFVQIADPIGGGLVASLSHPGGNITGFTLFEYAISAKWLELLKQIAPRLTHAAVLVDRNNTAGMGQFAAIQAVAGSLHVELSTIDLRTPTVIEQRIAALAARGNSGLIGVASSAALVHRELLVTLAAHHSLPDIYSYRLFAETGALIAYGPDRIDQYRRAAGYVDRILRGEKPGDLPVQNPTKYELVLNRKAANSRGLEVPPSLLALADEVID